jgi:hypothetical protein
MIPVEFRVRYHPAPVWKSFRRLELRGQVPEQRPLPRNAHAMAQWTRPKGPALKKRPSTHRPSRLSG